MRGMNVLVMRLLKASCQPCLAVWVTRTLVVMYKIWLNKKFSDVRLYYTLPLLYYYTNNRTRNERIMVRGDGQMPKRLVRRR